MLERFGREGSQKMWHERRRENFVCDKTEVTKIVTKVIPNIKVDIKENDIRKRSIFLGM